MDIIGLGFTALRRGEDLKRFAALVMPLATRVYAAALPIWRDYQTQAPEIKTLGESLWKEFAPFFGIQALATPPPAYDVKWLQDSLNKLGAKIPVDGDYGGLTKAAVERFQKSQHLHVDGWAGPKETLPVIKHELAKLKDGGRG